MRYGCAMVKDIARQVLDAAKSRKQARATDLSRWLADSYEELAPVLNVPGAPWSAVAETYNRAHPDRTPVQRGSVKASWDRLTVHKAGARVSARPEILAKPLPQPPPVRTDPVIDPIAADDELEFRTLPNPPR